MKKDDPAYWDKLHKQVRGKLSQEESDALSRELTDPAVKEDLAFLARYEQALEVEREINRFQNLDQPLADTGKGRVRRLFGWGLGAVAIAASLVLIFLMRFRSEENTHTAYLALTESVQPKPWEEMTLSGGEESPKQIRQWLAEANYSAVIEELFPAWEAHIAEASPITESTVEKWYSLAIALSFQNSSNSAQLSTARQIWTQLQTEFDDSFLRYQARLQLYRLAVINDAYQEAQQWLQRIIQDEEIQPGARKEAENLAQKLRPFLDK